MKKLVRYITADTEVTVDTHMFNGTPFKCDTDTSYYNDFLNDEDLKYKQEAKNRTGKIVMMSAKEYYDYCANDIFKGRHSVEELMQQREYSKFEDDTRFVDKYAEDMRNGAKFPLCYLNFADSSQEGLHRMYAAGEAFGWNTKFPVLVVTVYDKEIERKNTQYQDAVKFNKYYLPDICEEASDNILDWDSPPPENFIEIFHNEIVKVASTFTADDEGPFDIDVTIEINTVDDGIPTSVYHNEIAIYLSRYEDYNFDTLSNPHIMWLEDLYDMTPKSDKQPDKSLDNISDDDIINLFFT